MTPKILIVDDRRENLVALKGLLGDLHAEVITATSGQDALSKALDHDFALVMMDVQMPDMDGFEAAGLMRGLSRTKNVPIMFVTALSKDKRHVFKGYGSGAVDYLFKPLDKDVVVPKVQVFLDLWSQQQALRDQAEELRRKNDELQSARDEILARTAELVRQNEALDRFARVACHDLKAPLRSVVGFVDLLRAHLGGIDETGETYVRYIVRAVERMNALVEDLLRFSRLGRESAPPERVDLNDLVEGVVEDLAAPVRETGAQVSHGALPTVWGWPLQLRRLFLNLIENAIKYHNSAPPEVRVEATERGTSWQIRVRDNGIGIDPKYQRKIFEPFERLHPQSRYEGTGIGLATCQKIAEYHGGGIVVQSEGDGSGSSFIVTLPTRPPSPPAEEDAKPI